MEFLSANTDCEFEREMRCREVCSPPANTGPKNTHLALCQELKNQMESDPNFLSKVIKGDKSWCFGYDPETKQASSQWKMPTSLRPKKARQVRSNVKTMFIVFFNVRGIVHQEFVPPGQTVNHKFYLEVLRRLKENV